jgi:hypothetical protein
MIAVIPSSFSRASTWFPEMFSTKSISPFFSAWIAGSSAWNTRKTTSSTCGAPFQ